MDIFKFLLHHWRFLPPQISASANRSFIVSNSFQHQCQLSKGACHTPTHSHAHTHNNPPWHKLWAVLLTTAASVRLTNKQPHTDRHTRTRSPAAVQDVGQWGSEHDEGLCWGNDFMCSDWTQTYSCLQSVCLACCPGFPLTYSSVWL